MEGQSLVQAATPARIRLKSVKIRKLGGAVCEAVGIQKKEPGR